MAALAPLAGRRKRRRKLSAQQIVTLPIEEFKQEQSTKGSYTSCIQPYIRFAIDNGWNSNLYPEAMQCSVLTLEYVQENDIKPICLPVNVDAYLKVFHRNGRRRCVGVISNCFEIGKSCWNSRTMISRPVLSDQFRAKLQNIQL